MDNIKVYCDINQYNYVIYIFSDIFEKPNSNSILVGEGKGDKYAHAQSLFNLKDENGFYNIKLIDIINYYK